MISNLTPLGAFRLPAGATPENPDGFSFGGGPIALDPSDGALFVAARSGQVAKLTIPEPGQGAINGLPVASYVQAFSDPTNGQVSQVNPTGYDEGLTGIGVTEDGELLVNCGIYYDANNDTRRATMLRPSDLRIASGTKLHAIYDETMQGHTSYNCICVIPPEWQPRLGGTMLTGGFGAPIINRGSLGPSAFAFDHRALLVDTGGIIPAVRLLDYPVDHPTLGTYDVPGPLYGAADVSGGMVIVDGYLLVFGRHGAGEMCYGIGSADPSTHQRTINGEDYCYDPTSSDKGQHLYPYRYCVWVYDLRDLERVKLGELQPWDVAPCDFRFLDLPMESDTQAAQIFGVGFDQATRRLYLSQRRGDQDGYSSRALIHVLQVTATSAPIPEPLPPVIVTAPDPRDVRLDVLEGRIGALEQVLDAVKGVLR